MSKVEVDGDEVKESVVEDLSSEDVVNKYRTAAEIANEAVKLVLSKVQDGVKIVDLCQAGDQLVLDRTGNIFNKAKGKTKVSKGLAFPTCISVNHTVGHFSPLVNNDAALKAGDVVKVYHFKTDLCNWY